MILAGATGLREVVFFPNPAKPIDLVMDNPTAAAQGIGNPCGLNPRSGLKE